MRKHSFIHHDEAKVHKQMIFRPKKKCQLLKTQEQLLPKISIFSQQSLVSGKKETLIVHKYIYMYINTCKKTYTTITPKK